MKVGAPAEVVARLAAVREEFEARQRAAVASRDEYSKDPELDQFMVVLFNFFFGKFDLINFDHIKKTKILQEAYYDMLVKYREELNRPLQEAMDFMGRIESQLNVLTNAPVRIFNSGNLSFSNS